MVDNVQNLNPGFPSDLLLQTTQHTWCKRKRSALDVICCPHVFLCWSLWKLSVFLVHNYNCWFLEKVRQCPSRCIFFHHTPCKHDSSSSVIYCDRFPIFPIMFFWGKVLNQIWGQWRVNEMILGVIIHYKTSSFLIVALDYLWIKTKSPGATEKADTERRGTYSVTILITSGKPCYLSKALLGNSLRCKVETNNHHNHNSLLAFFRCSEIFVFFHLEYLFEM